MYPARYPPRGRAFCTCNLHGSAFDFGRHLQHVGLYATHTADLPGDIDRYGLQCLANLDLLPPTGSVILAAPLKIRRGSGSPLRVLALVPRGKRQA